MSPLVTFHVLVKMAHRALKGGSSLAMWDVTVDTAKYPEHTHAHARTHTHAVCPCLLALNGLSRAGVCPHSLHKLLSNMAHNNNKASQLPDSGATLN